MLVCVFTSVASETRPSQNVIDFMNVLNGVFTNKKQVDDEIAQNSSVRHELSVFTFLPVVVPAFGETPVICLRQIYAYMLEQQLLVVKETDDGNILITPYHFTKNLYKGSRLYDLKIYKDLTEDDFTYIEDCNIVFTRVASDFYVGHWPDCVDRTQPDNKLNVTCNVLTIEVTSSESPEYGLEPYYHELEGNKFPLPPFLSDIDKNKVCS
uniref:Uncharacterized protein n=2 Tax=Biomphalaria glabrata TaxID=6526 RepID=A0A2C9JRN1_BIOGL